MSHVSDVSSDRTISPNFDILRTDKDFSERTFCDQAVIYTNAINEVLGSKDQEELVREIYNKYVDEFIKNLLKYYDYFYSETMFNYLVINSEGRNASLFDIQRAVMETVNIENKFYQLGITCKA